MFAGIVDELGQFEGRDGDRRRHPARGRRHHNRIEGTGAPVNIEVDIMAKHVERLVTPYVVPHAA